MTCAALGRFRKEQCQSRLLSPRGPQGQETDFRVGFSADVERGALGICPREHSLL